MGRCDDCKLYSREYDEMRQKNDDVIIIADESRREKHFCVMYDENIPDGVYYGEENCPYYINTNG